MMFIMRFRGGDEQMFHEWGTLKADLKHEYGYNNDDLYRVLEALVDRGIFRDAAAFIEKTIDFAEIVATDDEEITNPRFFCETWLLDSSQTGAAYPTLREAIDFARFNHEFLLEQAENEDTDENSSESNDEPEQIVNDENGNTVFEITFDGTERRF